MAELKEEMGLKLHLAQHSFNCTNSKKFSFRPLGSGEESIPMLMFGNHSEKEDSLSRNRLESGDAKITSQMAGLSSNQGTPIKVLEVKSGNSSTTISVLASGL